MKRSMESPSLFDEDEEQPKRSRKDIDVESLPTEEDIPKLENWAIVNKAPQDPYKDPATFGTAMLRGIVYGHPLKNDGKLIWTSPLVYQEKDLARTCSRWFRLGTPEEGFEAFMREQGMPPKNEDGTLVNAHHHFTKDEQGNFKASFHF